MSRRTEYSRLGPDRESNLKKIFAIGICAVTLNFVLWMFFMRSNGDFNTSATAVLRGDSKVVGEIYFQQTTANGPVTITGKITNLEPNAPRGFHIHQYGDLSNGCTSTGSHFNPEHELHGGPDAHVRHVGDLGNIVANKDGVANLNLKDSRISLNGDHGIIGRAVVVHLGTDDLGKGGNDESLKTGNAGGRAACGVIGLLTA